LVSGRSLKFASCRSGCDKRSWTLLPKERYSTSLSDRRSNTQP